MSCSLDEPRRVDRLGGHNPTLHRLDTRGLLTLPPPVHKINNDLLWYIFKVIAEDSESEEAWESAPGPLNKPDALTSVRYGSQVCRTWRSGIISASALWGKLINLNALNQKTGSWRDIVLFRSARSPLWIRGFVRTVPSRERNDWKDSGNRNEEFFFHLLEEHLSRIERLQVYVEKLNVQKWGAITEAAPLLRVFDVNVCSVGTSRLDPWSPVPVDTPVFTNVALSNPHPAWFSSLRRLTLGNCAAYSELFKYLPEMSVLEYLCLKGPICADEFLPRQIPLPHLQQLVLSGIFTNMLPFVTYLLLSPGCSFDICAKHNENAPAGSLVNIQSWISAIMRSYFLLHHPESLHVVLKEEQFFFRDVRLERDIPFFQIDAFAFRAEESQDGLIPFYLQACKSSRISLIKTLRLRLDFLKCMEARIAQPFFNFISVFQSVTTLKISEYSIHVLLNTFPTEAKRLFPQLKMLSMTYLMGDPFNPARCGAICLTRFLDLRGEVGLKVLTLEISELKPESGHSGKDYDLRELERFSKLHVHWNINGAVAIYQCGNGRPENLRYSHHVMHWSGPFP